MNEKEERNNAHPFFKYRWMRDENISSVLSKKQEVKRKKMKKIGVFCIAIAIALVMSVGAASASVQTVIVPVQTQLGTQTQVVTQGIAQGLLGIGANTNIQTQDQTQGISVIQIGDTFGLVNTILADSRIT